MASFYTTTRPIMAPSTSGGRLVYIPTVGIPPPVVGTVPLAIEGGKLGTTLAINTIVIAIPAVLEAKSFNPNIPIGQVRIQVALKLSSGALMDMPIDYAISPEELSVGSGPMPLSSVRNYSTPLIVPFSSSLELEFSLWSTIEEGGTRYPAVLEWGPTTTYQYSIYSRVDVHGTYIPEGK